jgi:diguanylate cyclase (GGDEF)-like protein
MSYSQLSQIGLMITEVVAISVLLLFLFRLRLWFGLSLLYVALGVFQQMQVLLATSIYVEVLSNLVISPGSGILFTSNLFAILLVYIREDASEARKLIYGIVAANLTLSLLSFLFGLHLDSSLTQNIYNLPRQLFIQDIRVIIVGTLVLALDVLLIIILYESISRIISFSLFLRIYLSMAIVLSLDTVLFVSGSFFNNPNYFTILVSGIVGKIIVAVFYSLVLTIYLRTFERSEFTLPRQDTEIHDIFQVLTYRQKYEALRAEVIKDSLTGLYNRGFFDEILPQKLEEARKIEIQVSLLMIDIDNFKKINDSYGHQVGDEVLKFVASTIKDSVRATDLPCRYGGEEFSVILSNADLENAVILANKIRALLHEMYEGTKTFTLQKEVTITIGVSSYPLEVTSVVELVTLADKRLYEGKESGKNRVVPSFSN